MGFSGNGIDTFYFKSEHFILKIGSTLCNSEGTRSALKDVKNLAAKNQYFGEI